MISVGIDVCRRLRGGNVSSTALFSRKRFHGCYNIRHFEPQNGVLTHCEVSHDGDAKCGATGIEDGSEVVLKSLR